jgi:hypothetical protein
MTLRQRLAVAAAAVLVLLAAVPAVLAANPSLAHTGRVLISTDGDIAVPAGQQADVVIVVKGTATIAGTVNTVVVVNGAAVLSGATVESIVAISSPVTLGTGSTVLGDVMKLDSVVTRTGDAVVDGSVRDIGLDLAGIGFVLGPLVLLLYLGFAVAMLAAGLLVAGLAARQVRSAEELITHHPWQSLAAGLAGVILPMVLVVALFVSVIGAPLGLAILFGLWPAIGLLGYIVTGIFIGDWILRRMADRPRERPYLASVIGLIVLQVLGIVPALSFLASLFGFGAVLMLGWLTLRGSSGATSVPQPTAMPMPA